MATSNGIKDGSRVVNPFTSLGKDFIKELQSIVQKILIDKGVDKNSDLVQSVEFTTKNSRDSLFMYVNDYYAFVSQGRKSKTKKIPIQALISWIKGKRISSTRYSTSQLAYIIQNSIYKAGIRGKNFIQLVENTVANDVEVNLADELSEYLADSLFYYFTKDVPFASGK